MGVGLVPASEILNVLEAPAGLRLQIEYVPIDSLKPALKQTRRHSRRQLKQLARSMAAFGFLVPVVVKGNVLVTGNARLAAAKLNGLREVPIVRAEHLTDEQMRLFAIADNKLSEGVEWDVTALAAEFADIAAGAPDLDQDLSGFSITERDIIFGRQRTDELADLDDGAAEPDARLTSGTGDVFRLGRHMLTCGDATDPEVVARVVGDRQVRTVASDLPYNVKIAGNVSGLGTKKHGEFAMASGEMDKTQFIDFLARAIRAVQPGLVDGALLYLFMDWRHVGELIAASEATDLGYLNLLVWMVTSHQSELHPRQLMSAFHPLRRLAYSTSPQLLGSTHCGH